jgi:hypothetical protein
VSLDALAPDQRAVVQLVLQQERSYEDLAGLLGITAAAVRERAHRGLDRLAPTEGVSDDERAAVADYLLGQQSVSRREATRSLLSTSNSTRAWAQAVRSELAEVAASPLPDVPGDTARIVEPEDDEGPFVPDAEAPAPDLPVIADPLAEAAPEETAPVRARPRPRERPVADYGFDAPEEQVDERLVPAADATRTSRLGGALLIAGLGIFVAALIIWLVRSGDDGEKTSANTESTPTATSTPSASATPEYQPIGALALKSATGGAAKGQMILFAARTGEVAFNIKATKVPPSEQGQAYGVWLTGGDKDHFLGFTPPVGDNGRLAVSGPRDRDQRDFARWFTSAKQLVVSTETQEGATSPGPLVLSANTKDLITAGTATPTPAP